MIHPLSLDRWRRTFFPPTRSSAAGPVLLLSWPSTSSPPPSSSSSPQSDILLHLKTRLWAEDAHPSINIFIFGGALLKLTLLTNSAFHSIKAKLSSTLKWKHGLVFLSREKKHSWPLVAWSMVISLPENREGANFPNWENSHKEVGKSGKGGSLKQFVTLFQQILWADRGNERTNAVVCEEDTPSFQSRLDAAPPTELIT